MTEGPYSTREGIGYRLELNGMFYMGYWMQGRAHGKGIAILPEKKGYYIGEWAYGRRHGHGVFNFLENEYEGDFI